MDDWDNIDWDEKVEKIAKTRQQQKANQDVAPTMKISPEDDGNYFNEIQEKMKLKQQQDKLKPGGSRRDSMQKDAITVQSYSIKDLVRIRSYNSSDVNLLICETFGQFERYLLTHQQRVTHEIIVELLQINVALLQIPFLSHNRKLLENISLIASFWSEVTKFVKGFLEHKHKDMKFLLSVDMNCFFSNIELLLHSLLVNNFFSSEVESFYVNILELMETTTKSEWNDSSRIQRLQIEYQQNLESFKFYDIYPTLNDLTIVDENLTANVVEGEYENVSHYLRVQLPLLKEDFISKLREAIGIVPKHKIKLEKWAKRMISRALTTRNPMVLPNVKIQSVSRKLWNMQCRLLIVQVKGPINLNRRFFTGQMLCFTSSPDLTDLVVAVVLKREIRDHSIELSIDIIKTENVTEIFEQDFIMIEPAAFFEPYHRVFNIMKNLNELNFPFKQQILKLQDSRKFPNYQHSDQFVYKGFSFNVKDLNAWPTSFQLSLECMQLKAVQKAVTSEFSVIQGPPGTGKTFVGLEILKILLDNTSETILILTQTNSALDKFLLGASKFTSNIARLGGQSKCEELEQFIFKAEMSVELKKYMGKLQHQLEQEVVKLMERKDNDEKIRSKISTHHGLIGEIHQLSSFQSVNQKRVVGMTTTFAAKNLAINKMLKPGIVIIEEASEVLESHVLVSLTSETKQVIMIGDHQQLRPLTNSYDLARNFNFDVSLFERLIRNNFEFITLDVQMRMRSEMCDLVRGTIYKQLKDGEKVDNQPDVKGMTRNFFCLSHSHPESVDAGETSKENPFEAEYIVQLCLKLLNSGNDASQITILTAYAAQAQRIQKRLWQLTDSNVRVAVLDAYQGEESDIILLSLVRSNEKHDIGFLATENRIAVLLSRAKFGFYIIANMKCLASASPIWKKVQQIMEEKGVIGDQIPDVEIFVK